MLTKTLTIAGFDSSGGAGLQADLKTFSAFGCYGMSILTALPIQNTCGVSNCYSIPLSAIEEQLAAIFGDLVPDAIKIGMLFNSEIINLVAKFLKPYAKNIPIVIDPVMIAKSGDYLLLPEAVDALITQLIPLATLITPNLNEATALTKTMIQSKKDMLTAANKILKLGPGAVLVKGGHLEGTDCPDLLINALNHTTWFNTVKVNTKNTHGTGCTLSAAITSCLALGQDLVSSCAIAKEYISQAIKANQNEVIGNGHGPVHHFYHLWPTLKLIKPNITSQKPDLNTIIDMI